MQIVELDIREKATKDGVTHLSTGVAVLRDSKILMVRRIANDYLGGFYELPGGGVDEGETITEAAIRETCEETGLIVSKIITEFEGFDYSTDKKPHVRQINFIVEVKSGDVVLDAAEHDDFVWVNIDNIENLNMTDNMRICVNNAIATTRLSKQI